MPPSSEIELVRGQRGGTVVLSPHHPVRFRTSDVEALVFVRGAARVALPEGAPELVDPVTAVWCAAGSVSEWAADGRETVRLDWHAPVALAVAVGAVALDLPMSAEKRPVRLYYSKPQLFLKQRLLAELGEVPRILGHSREEWLAPMGLQVPSADSTDSAEAADASSRRLASAIRGLLVRGYREAIPLPEIASAVGCSTAHASRLFKRYTGLAPVPYRHQLRMRAALDLLDQEPADLLDIALTLGYASHSHFTGRFKEIFGMTPSHYRRLSRRARQG